MTRTGETSSKTARAITSDAITTSMTKNAGNTLTVGNNRACSNGGSGKDRGSNGAPLTEDRRGSTKPICNRDG